MATSKVNQRRYNSTYYEKNKDKIAERRKKKYWSDPSYRNTVRSSSRERYQETAKSKDARIGYTVKRADGQELYTITYAAQVANRKEETLRSWEKAGDVPKTTYTDSRGWRLYTAHQIEILSIAFKKYDEGEWTREIVRSYLHNNWRGKPEGG